MKDFVFSEMREHAKLLELYSRMFEETTQRINIQKEFVDCIAAGERFPPNEAQEFVGVKLKGMMAAELGAQFRGGGSQGGARSQSANRPQRMNTPP